MKEIYALKMIIVINISIVFIYPSVFNYFYAREKKIIKGLWDIPKVISYY